ncbi:MAG: cell wall anchor, partial [Chloroflexus aggregans]
MIRKLSIALTTALLFALLAVPAFAQSGTAKVRVIHASPDAPAVDVFVNGNAVLTNVGFFAASPYLDLPAGTY